MKIEIMEKNTVLLSLEDYNDLKNNEVNIEELKDSYDSKIEDILNGESVELLEPTYETFMSGKEYIVKSGCNFYSVSDTAKELGKELKSAYEGMEKFAQVIEKLKERTLLDFILRK